jgi:hypothetical protein
MYDIETRTWNVSDLIKHKDVIIKPKFQRDAYWTMLPENGKNFCNNKEYILFLIKHRHTCYPLSLAIEYVDNKKIYIIIDGNNRINAIIKFMEYPYKLFKERFEELFNAIKNSSFTIEHQDKIIKNIKNISFEKLCNYRNFIDIYNNNDNVSYNDIRKIDEEFFKIIKSFEINGNRSIHEIIKVLINEFEGGTMEEYAETFVEINKKNTTLSMDELLSGSLYSTDVNISNIQLCHKIQENIEEFYKKRGDEEVLEKYKFNKDYNNNTLNAFDFMVGFQDYISSKCNLVPKFLNTKNKNQHSLFFKLFKFNYCEKDLEPKYFTTENINNFIDNITYAFGILNKIQNSFNYKNVSYKLFNKSIENTVQNKLKDNNKLVLFLSLFRYKEKKIDETIIIKELTRVILYHCLVDCKNIKEEAKLKELQLHDKLVYHHGGSHIQGQTDEIVRKHNYLSSSITKEVFGRALNLILQPNNVCNKNKPIKRRPWRFIDKLLLSSYYQETTSIKNLYNDVKYSIEHIIPFSSTWDKGNELDIDRLGNLFPIPLDDNVKRGNRDISYYQDKKLKYHDYYKNLEILPKTEEYYKYNKKDGNNTKITNINMYNDMCKRNEELYISSFLKDLFN